MVTEVRTLTRVTKADCWCGTPVGKYKSSGLCRKHHDQRKRALNTRVCEVTDCDHPTKSATYSLCMAHWQRLRRTGDLGTTPIEPRTPGSTEYKVIHTRVRRMRGPASVYACACGCGCGQSADDWAYDHDDPDQITAQRRERDGSLVWLFYSTNVMHYTPLCKGCHNLQDKAKAKARREAGMIA